MLQNSLVKQWWRLGGITGILFVILFIVGIVVQGSTPAYGDPVDEIRQKWIDNGQSYLIGDYIIGLSAVLFFFPFISALRSYLGIAEGGSQVFSRIIMVGAIIFLGVAGAASAAWTTLAFGDFARDASDDTINTLMGLDAGATHFIFAGTALMALATGAAIMQTKALPVWLCALSLIYGVLALIAPLSVLSNKPDDSILTAIGFLGALIWFLVTAATLAMQKEAPRVTSVSVATAPSAAAT